MLHPFTDMLIGIVRGILRGLFFVLSSACCHQCFIKKDTDLILLGVIIAPFTDDTIFWEGVPPFLSTFIEFRLGIFGEQVLRKVMKVRLIELEDENTRNIEALIEVERTKESFHRIGKEGTFLATTIALFAFVEE